MTFFNKGRKDILFRSTCGFFCFLFIAVISALIVGLVHDGYTAFVRTKVHTGEYIGSKYQVEVGQLSGLLCERCKEHVGWVDASDNLDSFYKNRIVRDKEEFHGRLDHEQIALVQRMREGGDIKIVFNDHLFTRGDAASPTDAGVLASMVGSIMIIAIAVFCVFPFGLIAGIYIGEFAKKSLLSTIIELSAKNLASVPSVVIGMFGLSFYVETFGLPRSSALVGGLTLGIIALPLITVTTKYALSSTPDSIKYSALALGASPLQVLWKHSLPMSMPIIITGFMLSIARIIGETAPLLVVGMVIFVRDIPLNLFDKVTTLPAQVYLWTKNPLRGFEELAAAAVLVLIIIVMCLNLLAGYIQKLYYKRHDN